MSDRICREAFEEFYIRKDYQLSLEKSKKVYRLLIKNNNIDTKDDFYIWMILMIIVQSFDKLNQIEKSYMYIHLSLKYVRMEYQKIDSYYYLIKFYIKINNNIKAEYYFWKCLKSCNTIEDYQILNRILDIRI